MAGLVLALLRPRNGEDVLVGSGIQSLSSVGCSHRFDVHDPCGTQSIWNCLFLLGLTLSRMATSEIFHVALLVGPATLRLSGGCTVEVNTTAAAQAEAVPGDPRRSLTFPRLLRDCSLFSLLLLGDLSLFACLLRLRSRFLSPLLFSF